MWSNEEFKKEVERQEMKKPIRYAIITGVVIGVLLSISILGWVIISNV